MHCAGDGGAGKGMMDSVRPERGVARPIAFAVPSRQASGVAPLEASGIASLQRPIAAASRVRNGTPAAAEMPPASGEVPAAEVTASKMTTAAATEVTTAAMSATTMSTTTMSTTTVSAPAMTATASATRQDRAGQRDRQHDDRQPFHVDVRHDIPPAN
jgi:hypothetical protein